MGTALLRWRTVISAKRILLPLVVLALGCGALPPKPITAKCVESPGDVPGTFLWNCPLADGDTVSFTTTELYSGQVEVSQ